MSKKATLFFPYDVMRNAWLKASQELGIEVVAPFILERSNGQKIEYVALIKDFGSENGTLITTLDHEPESPELAEEYGYYWAALNPEAYSQYDRSEFIATLDDWGWFGDEAKRPSWYTGQPWS